MSALCNRQRHKFPDIFRTGNVHFGFLVNQTPLFVKMVENDQKPEPITPSSIDSSLGLLLFLNV